MNLTVKPELKQKLLEHTYLFYDKGLTTSLDSGDISLRDPETNLIYIDPRPDKNFKIPNWRSISIDDVAVVDMEGNRVGGGSRYPTVELPMHLAIYKARPETYGIVHSHALYSGVFATLGWDIPAALVETVFHSHGDIICAEYGKVASKELANNIVKALGKERTAALLRQHGAVYIGKTIEEAFVVADYVEKAAQTVIMAWSMRGELLKLDTKIEDLLDQSILSIADEI